MDTNEEKLLLKDEVFQIVGCAIEVLNTLGHGLVEKPYENALVVEFGLRKIPFRQQPSFDVLYKGRQVGLFIPDWASALPCSTACLTPLRITSSRNSTSSGSTTSLSILIAMISPAPFAVTFTFPPPALTSIVCFSSSACVFVICSCIF